MRVSYLARPGVYAVLLGLISGTIIAFIRFLPVFDYPHWIYQAHVLANFPNYSEWFYVEIAPIPNLGSTLFLWPLTLLMGAEAAGRVLVSVYAFSVVITFYYLIRGLSGNSGLIFFGPAFVFNYFFFNGFLSFLVGVPVLLLTIGIFLRVEKITPRRWILLASLSALAYLSHLFIWLPILAYTVIRALLSLITGRKTTAVGLGTTQIVPFVLLIVYIVGRTSQEAIEWSYYQSLPDKLFSIVAPMLPFSRTDPFPVVLPIAILNAAFGLVIFLLLLIAVRHFKKDKEIRGVALLITALVLLLIALLIPVNWFGGMGAVDQRFAFLGFVLLIAYLGRYVPSRFQLLFAVIAIVILGFQSLVFISNDKQLRLVHKALQSRELGSSMYVASLRHPPIYGECDPKIWNAGNGVFPLQWFPLFDVIERDHLYVSTFNTALLHSREGSHLDVSFDQYQTVVDRATLVNKINTNELSSFDYLILFGCPADLDSVSIIWQSESGELVNQGDYYRLVRLR